MKNYIFDKNVKKTIFLRVNLGKKYVKFFDDIKDVEDLYFSKDAHMTDLTPLGNFLQVTCEPISQLVLPNLKFNW